MFSDYLYIRFSINLKVCLLNAVTYCSGIFFIYYFIKNKHKNI